MSGPKSDQAVIEARRSRLIELLADGKTAAQAAEVLRAEGFPASHDAVERDVKALASSWRKDNADAIGMYAGEQYLFLQDLKGQLSTPGIKPDRKIELALGILDREMKLLGTAAPTKSITAHVDATNTTLQYQFLEHSHGLTPDQIQQVFTFMDALPRAEMTIDMSGFARALPPGDEGKHDRS